MKILHTADMHLCHSLRASKLPAEIADEHRKQLFFSFYALIEAAKNEAADVMLIAGDLFEADFARPSDVKRIADAFCAIPDIRIFISCGNHDPLTSNSLYNSVEFPPNVTIFPGQLTCVSIDELGLDIYGFSWVKNRYDEMPFNLPELDENKKNVLCLHGDAMGRSNYMPLNVNALYNTGFDYVALGHIHKPTKLKNNICYPGSPEPLDFGEDGAHGYIKLTIDESGVDSEFVELAKRSFVTAHVDVSGVNTYSQLESLSLDAAGEKEGSLVRLIYEGTLNTEISLEAVRDNLIPHFYYLQIVDETQPDYDLVKLYRENEDNIIGKFTLELMHDAQHDEEARAALYAGLDALLGQGRERK